MKKLILAGMALAFLLAALAGCEAKDGRTQENTDITVSRVMKYQDALARYTELENLCVDIHSPSSPPSPEDPSAFTSREVVIPLNVTDSCKPALHFLCRTSEGESSDEWEISYIWHAALLTDGGDTACRFNGNVEFWLRDGSRIEYAVNGDFYKGAEAVSQGIFSGVVNTDESGFFTSVVSDEYASAHHDYFYIHETAALK